MMARTPLRPRHSEPGTQTPGRRPGKRRAWHLTVLLAAIALCLVWIYRVDLSHATAIVAGAIVMGLCNEFADGLSTQRLTPVKLKGLEQGATEQQFLAYSLTGDRPVGERAYRHFVRLAKGRLAKLGISLKDDDDGSRRGSTVGSSRGSTVGSRLASTDPDDAGAHTGHRISRLLYRAVTDPERGGRLTHAELTKCLDELDDLDQAVMHGRIQQPYAASRRHSPRSEAVPGNSQRESRSTA